MLFYENVNHKEKNLFYCWRKSPLFWCKSPTPCYGTYIIYSICKHFAKILYNQTWEKL